MVQATTCCCTGIPITKFPMEKRLTNQLKLFPQTFKELLQSLVALQKVQDEKAKSLYEMLLNNVCYVLEYRETMLNLLMNYSETNSTK